MEINFFDPQHVPQPKDNIRIESLKASPYPDGWRVRVAVDVTPFQERPSLAVKLIKDGQTEVGSLDIIETMHRNMEFTIHIRYVASPVGAYTLTAALYFGDDPKQSQHQVETQFSI
jgi:hypothetical protein